MSRERREQENFYEYKTDLLRENATLKQYLKGRFLPSRGTILKNSRKAKALKKDGKIARITTYKQQEVI